MGGDLEENDNFQKKETGCALNKKHGKSHFQFENRSFVDVEIGNESMGGDLEENGQCLTPPLDNI